jgi:small subunit ribosomal protein S13
MVRISGVDLPRNKRVQIGLTSIFGIGYTSSDKILIAASISPNIRCSDLTDEQIASLRSIIDENYQTEGDLRRLCSLNIKRLTETGSATGRRHRVNLPVRGQRTRTNARTRKGKVKGAVANKKGR